MLGWSRAAGARLLLEVAPALGVRAETLGEHLHGDIALELRVARAVDFPHRAGADARANLVAPQPLSDHRRTGNG